MEVQQHREIALNNNAGAIKDYRKGNHQAETYHNLNKVGMAYNTTVNARYFSFGYNFGYPVWGVNATVGGRVGQFCYP